jgi:hypothetical protein
MREKVINRLAEFRHMLVDLELEWEHHSSMNQFNRLIYANKIACLKNMIDEFQKLLEP